MLNEVENPHRSKDGYLRDITDGRFCTCNHPVFSKDEKALQVIGYYDDLEVANPLGSKAKIHKIGKHLCYCRKEILLVVYNIQ